jgi:hypothetical protein
MVCKGLAGAVVMVTFVMTGCDPMVKAENKAKEACAKEGLQPYIYDLESTHNAFAANTATLRLHCIDPNDVVHTPAFVGLELLASETVKGAMVLQVLPGTAAAKAGLAGNDVVYQYADKPIATVNDLVSAISTAKSGDEIELRIRRGKQDLTLTSRF